VAYVAQSAQAALNPAIQVGEQVSEGLVLHDLAGPAEARARAIELLTRLDLPDPPALAQRYPHQASGGQQQRIMIAMALACAPKLLVLDEPTTALDVTTQIEVLQAIKDVIRERDAAAIYVSHDLAVVAQVADRIVVMNRGAIVEQGTTEEILHRPKEPYTRTLMAAVKPKPRPGAPGPIAAPRPAEQPLLAVRGLGASYARPKFLQAPRREDNVLHEVSLEVYPREVLALVGESGCGKSTLARVIAGLHPPVAGQVLLQGVPLAPTSRRRPVADLRRIQIVFQSPDQSLNPEQRIEEAIGRPLRLYFDLTGPERSARIAELLRMVGLPEDYAGRYPSELSGGERQRVSLARAFAAEPDLILCDEVLSSLDTVVAAQVLDLMRELKDRHRVAYLFISHDLATVATIADRVAVLYAGRIVDVGPTGAVFGPPHHPYTQLLLSSVPELRQGWLEEVVGSREAQAGRRGLHAYHDALCPFRNRCPLAVGGLCDREPPPVRDLGGGHAVACHRDGAELAAAQDERRLPRAATP
jgi:peptide/nickel transport system ATP-binding protein